MCVSTFTPFPYFSTTLRLTGWLPKRLTAFCRLAVCSETTVVNSFDLRIPSVLDPVVMKDAANRWLLEEKWSLFYVLLSLQVHQDVEFAGQASTKLLLISFKLFRKLVIKKTKQKQTIRFFGQGKSFFSQQSLPILRLHNEARLQICLTHHFCVEKFLYCFLFASERFNISR